MDIAQIRTLLNGAPTTYSERLLEQLLALETSKLPQGKLYPIEGTVFQGTPNDQPIGVPLYQLIIANDGPNALQYRIPSGSRSWVTLAVTEAHVWNSIYPVILSVSLQVIVPGGLAAFRIAGLY